jgi:inhibitor of cysteine peptidase
MQPPPFEQRKTRVGEPFTIRVKSNPTTGFGWQAIYDPNSVALIDKSFEQGSVEVGGGGEEVLTFQATRPGRVTITLELRRPWEKGSRESRSYEINVDP